MTLLFLYQNTPSGRLNDTLSPAIASLRQFIKRERFFYSKERFSVLLIHHYQFLLNLHQRFNQKQDLAIYSPLNKVPYLHCLRADIKDVCACCPWAKDCDVRNEKRTACLGQALAHFLIGDFFLHQYRRLDDYLGATSSKRFFTLQCKNHSRQKAAFTAFLDECGLKAKEEGEVAAYCIATLKKYTHDLSFAVRSH